MSPQTPIPSLNSLEYLPYLDENGSIEPVWQGKIGVYAIFDRDKVLQFVGYSRNIYLSLKQHLVRCPQSCYWVKIEMIARPSRTILEEIKKSWIEENGFLPIGNDTEENKWNKPLDVKPLMTAEDKAEYNKLEEIAQIKLLKKIARRFEEEILETLKDRGVNMDIRFNPKLKEQGLLDLK
ncbi:MAG: GIY-YIG nuclease family protein [Okeania sp. SIO2D1]|nr:GIY-YIG nuclease family protein [Okeania sp. SIO2D1]